MCDKVFKFCLFMFFLFFFSFTQNFKKFLQRMLDPTVGTGAVDVYAWMFSAQFIIFLIILSSWSAFSSSEVNRAYLFVLILGFSRYCLYPFPPQNQDVQEVQNFKKRYPWDLSMEDIRYLWDIVSREWYHSQADLCHFNVKICHLSVYFWQGY